MEDELIKYILELVDGNDYVCDELHGVPSEEEYCSKHCNNLCADCIRRLMYKRMLEG